MDRGIEIPPGERGREKQPPPPERKELLEEVRRQELLTKLAETINAPETPEDLRRRSMETFASLLIGNTRLKLDKLAEQAVEKIPPEIRVPETYRA